MPSYERNDIIGKWSLEKFELLRKYLAGYLIVLTNQTWCRGYEYIDAFAGTGKPKTKDEQRYVDGSPRIALGLMPSFTQYHFIECANVERAYFISLKCFGPYISFRILLDCFCKLSFSISG